MRDDMVYVLCVCLYVWWSVAPGSYKYLISAHNRLRPYPPKPTKPRCRIENGFRQTSFIPPFIDLLVSEWKLVGSVSWLWVVRLNAMGMGYLLPIFGSNFLDTRMKEGGILNHRTETRDGIFRFWCPLNLLLRLLLIWTAESGMIA